VLGEVRGKIVLLRRFYAEDTCKGINATAWPENDSFFIRTAGATLRIQDVFKVPHLERKWQVIESLYAESSKGDSSCLYINFISGHKPLLFFIPRIKPVSSVMNAKVEAYFKPRSNPVRAVTVFDFADGELCSAVLDANPFNDDHLET
jgi:1-phosphatidylinositol phosphodiesterase